MSCKRDDPEFKAICQAAHKRVVAVLRCLDLISVKQGKADWSLADVTGADVLPAVRWRLEDLAKLSAEKRAKLLSSLSEVLGIEE